METKEKFVYTTIQVDPVVHRKLKVYLAKKNVKMKHWVDRIIQQSIKANR